MLIEDARLDVEQRDVAAARTAGDGLAHLADHVVVDRGEDLRPERRLGDVGVDVDEEIILVALGLPRGVREDVARVRLHGDFLQFAELRRGSLEHGGASLKRLAHYTGNGGRKFYRCAGSGGRLAQLAERLADDGGRALERKAGHHGGDDDVRPAGAGSEHPRAASSTARLPITSLRVQIQAERMLASPPR